MKIGFTYDLKSDYLKEGYSDEDVAEFDSEITINAVVSVIEKMGHTVEKIGNFKSLAKKLLNNERWDFIFNICEGLYGSGREALVPALLDAYGIPYTFSNPLLHAVTLDKAVAKMLLAGKGIPTADFIQVKDTADIHELKCSYPYFVKPVSEGTGKGVTPASVVYNKTDYIKEVSNLLDKFKQAVLVEPFLSGREVTVGVIGNGSESFCIGVMEVGFTDKADSNIHSYYNKANCEEAAVYTLATDAFAEKCAEISVRTHKELGIQDLCRIDIRADEHGNPYVLEINTLPGLMPERSDLVLLAQLAGKSYDWLIQKIIDVSIKRIFAKDDK